MAHYRSFRVLSIFSAMAVVAASVSRAFSGLADLIVATVRDDMRFYPSANASIVLDRVAADFEHQPTAVHRFRAFVSRALRHERYSGDGFAAPAGSST